MHTIIEMEGITKEQVNRACIAMRLKTIDRDEITGRVVVEKAMEHRLGKQNPKVRHFPSDCIPVAHAITNILWKACQEVRKNLPREFWAYSGYTVTDETETVIRAALANHFRLYETHQYIHLPSQTKIGFPNDPSGLSNCTSRGELHPKINIHCSWIAVTAAKKFRREAKALLANLIYHEMCHHFQDTRKREDPANCPHKLRRVEVTAFAMGEAAEIYYKKISWKKYRQESRLQYESPLYFYKKVTPLLGSEFVNERIYKSGKLAGRAFKFLTPIYKREIKRQVSKGKKKASYPLQRK